MIPIQNLNKCWIIFRPDWPPCANRCLQVRFWSRFLHKILVLVGGDGWKWFLFTSIWLPNISDMWSQLCRGCIWRISRVRFLRILLWRTYTNSNEFSKHYINIFNVIWDKMCMLFLSETDFPYSTLKQVHCGTYSTILI